MTINTAFMTALQVTVKDSSNNTVAGVSVTFVSSRQRRERHVWRLATVTTDSAGIATAPTFSANSVAGKLQRYGQRFWRGYGCKLQPNKQSWSGGKCDCHGRDPAERQSIQRSATAPPATVKDAGNNPASGVSDVCCSRHRCKRHLPAGRQPSQQTAAVWLLRQHLEPMARQEPPPLPAAFRAWLPLPTSSLTLNISAGPLHFRSTSQFPAMVPPLRRRSLLQHLPPYRATNYY